MNNIIDKCTSWLTHASEITIRDYYRNIGGSYLVNSNRSH